MCIVLFVGTSALCEAQKAGREYEYGRNMGPGGKMAHVGIWRRGNIGPQNLCSSPRHQEVSLSDVREAALNCLSSELGSRLMQLLFPCLNLECKPFCCALIDCCTPSGLRPGDLHSLDKFKHSFIPGRY